MASFRDNKREKFTDESKRNRKTRPLYIISIIAVVVGIGIAGILLSAGSGNSDEETGNLLIDVTGVESEKANNPDLDQTGTASSTVANLDIEGMFCGGCSSAIMQALSGVEGIDSSDISWRNDTGIVEFQPELITAQEIADFISEMGYATSIAE